MNKTLLAVAGGLVLLAPIPSFAGFITGSVLNVSGAGIVGATFVNWQCSQPLDPACVVPPAGKGDFSVANSTGSFAVYNGTFGLISNINNGAQPLNTPFSLPNFMTFSLNNTVSIELTFIPLGNDTLSTDCAGLAHCTPTNSALITAANPGGVSAFNLDQNLSGTNAVFGIKGIVHNTVDGSVADLAGTFSTNFTGQNPQQALAAALAGSSKTYSSNLVLTVMATTPEPSTIGLAGLGLLCLGLFKRRRKDMI